MYPQTPSEYAGHMQYGQVTPGAGDGIDEYYENLPHQWTGVETVGLLIFIAFLQGDQLTDQPFAFLSLHTQLSTTITPLQHPRTHRPLY